MTTILITGANRGIGRGIADIFLSRPNTTLVALVRDPSDETTTSLKPLSKDTKVIVLPYNANDDHSAQAAVSSLHTEHNITALDIVIVNAGGMSWQGPSIEASPETMLSHFHINTIGPLQLFKATLPLLQASKNQPTKFFTISSGVGSTELVPKRKHLNVLPYGASKAAVNHVMRKLHTDHPDIVVELLAPGHVATDLTRSLRVEGQVIPAAAVSLKDSVKGLVRQIDMANLETTNGGFKTWKGEVVPW